MSTKEKAAEATTPAKKIDGDSPAKSVFETRDINLASYLKLKNYELKSVVVDRDRVIFGFLDKKDVAKREQDVLDFYNDKGKFLTYTNAWKDLKSLLHNYKK